MSITARMAIDRLATRYDRREASNIVEYLLRDAFGWSRTDFYLCKDKEFPANQAPRFSQMLERLLKDEPLQYVVGRTEWDDCIYKLTPSVLIPRDDTHMLVRHIVQAHAGTAPRILDMGSGSGCIAIYLARHIAQASVEAWDISADALSVARANAEGNGVKVDFCQRDMLAPELPPDEPAWDIIVSNPPYVREQERASMRRNVLYYEPATALFVTDDDPLLFYRAIARYARRALLPDGVVYVEINAALHADTAALFASAGFAQVSTLRYLDGAPRFLICRR